MAWTGFGGSWSNGVHSGGDDSGSIGGSSINLDGRGNPVNTRAPTAAEIAAQFNSYGGKQITASMVSNIRADGFGGYNADVEGAYNTVSSSTGSRTSTTLGAFSGVSKNISTANGSTSQATGANPTVSWDKMVDNVRKGLVHSGLKLKDGKIGQDSPSYTTMSLGHGERKEVYAGIKFLEIPVLTAAYQKGLAERRASRAAYERFRAAIDAWKIDPNPDAKGPVVPVSELGPGDLASANALYKDGIAIRKQRAEQKVVQDAVKFTAAFYQQLTDKLGKQYADIAEQLKSTTLYSKKIRNADQAIAAFEKFQNVLNKKYSVADREAIAKTLEAVNRAEMAKNLATFSKAFGYVGISIDAYNIFLVELPKAIRTNTKAAWHTFFVKCETVLLGIDAALLVAYSFSLILGTPIGMLTFALIMATVGAMMNDNVSMKINALFGL